MNKFWILLSFLFIVQCSFDTKTGIWTQDKKIKETSANTTQIFKKKETTKKELNTNLNLKIDLSKVSKKDFGNLTNNSGLVSFNALLIALIPNHQLVSIAFKHLRHNY